MNYKEKIASLTLEEKVQLLTGEDFWTTYAQPKIGLRKMVVSDGPSGVRGELWDERSDSLSLPSATAFASTWDREVMGQVGEVMAFEARRKNVDVVLGPTINLHRSPLGGRHFEAYSEDSVLSGKMAAAFVNSIQNQGVGACLKHFVANDAETDRHTVNNIVDEQTLREVYALPFEIAVRDAHPWTIMSAYNRVNGPKMAASPLLNSILKEEWGWDGMVVSDWTGVQSTEDTGREGNDLEMPGPFGFWGEKLIAAVKNGEVPESAIDAKVERILRLAERVGKYAAAEVKAAKQFTDAQLNAAARAIGAKSIVLAKNSGALPLENISKIAVIGAHARFGRGQGGGSATVYPKEFVGPLDGLRSVAPAGTSIEYALGAKADSSLIQFDKTYWRNPDDNTPGCKAEVFDKDGKIVMTEQRYAGFFNWTAEPWCFNYSHVKVSGIFTAEKDGTYEFGVGMVGDYTVRIAGKEHKGFIPMHSDDLGEFILNPPFKAFPHEMKKGEEVLLEYEYPSGALPIPVAAFYVGFKEPERAREIEFAEATKLAAESDVALVFVGTTSEIESEGHDRKNISLPDGHDELVSAVAKAAKRTVVIVNAGSPVEMPWFKEVDSVLLTWFGGQQMGTALADVIFGNVNPSGHLPTTWGAKISDVPVLNTTPKDGKLEYSEGRFIGYRAWSKAKRTPLLPFGFGLSYTTFTSELVHADRKSAKVTVTNTGSRDGAEVIQIYALHSSAEKFERRLAGFAKVSLKAGESTTVDVDLEPLVFKKFANGWHDIEGQWQITLATDAHAEGQTITTL